MQGKYFIVMADTKISKISLKLLIDTKSQKVLFAEAGKEFVDFLLSLLSLPVGTAIRLLKREGMVGCLGDLYESIENLSDTFIQPNQAKDSILKPKALICGFDVPLLLPVDGKSQENSVYMCGHYSCRRWTDDPQAICSGCQCRMSTKATYVGANPVNTVVGARSEGGFVKGVVTYIVMDNLEVKPMSTISSITLLNKFKVKEVGALEERTVALTIDKGLKLLKTSLQTKTVLTSFLENSGA